MDLLFFVYIAISPLLVGFILVFLMVTGFAVVFLVIYVKELATQEKNQPYIAGSIINLLVYFNTLFDYLTYLSRKHSTFRMITPSNSEIFTADPVLVEYILKTNFTNYTKGAYNYDRMKDLFGDGIFAVDGEKWRHQRKLASYEFSTKVLRDFSSTVFLSNAVKLVAKVSKMASLGSMDLQDLLMKTALDSIFKVGFGIELNSLSGLDEFGKRFSKAFDDSNVIVYWRYVDPFWKIKRFLNIGLEASLKRNIKVIDDFVFRVIRAKREQMKTEKVQNVKEDILSRFITEGENDPEKMTAKYLRDIILNFIIAGKDSSANTLTWFFYMLCKHPLIQEKVLREVREVTNAEDVISSDKFAERLTEEALDKMQYLHAALTETLRLYPAVPVDGKSAENDDILPNGLKIRKGDGVNYMPYAMGRMIYIWGDDAEEFQPERWIENGKFRPESYFKFTAFQGEFNYDLMKDLFGDGIFAVDGEKWLHQRKLASYEFSTKNLRDFSTTVFRSSAAKLVAKISEMASLGSMDLQDLLMKSTLDSIFKVGFGIDLNSLSGLDEFGKRFSNAFDDSNVIVFWRFADPFWKIERFLNIGLEASLKRNIKVIDDFVFQVIRAKREQMKTEKVKNVKEDILSRFITESEKDPEKMTDKYLRDIILNFLIAGKDSSANTLTWFFYMLCKHPLIQEKVLREVQEATNAEEVISSEEFAEKLTEEALDKMQYLHAALTETLRLYPAVPVDGKNAENDDILPNGLKVKKGDGLNYMAYAMGRMTYIWGEDAEEFKPERWIENGKFRPESYFKFTAFQAGPRICLGREFAYRQMKILAAILLNFFKFKLVDQVNDATYRTMFTLHMAKGLHLFAVPRMN